MYPPDPSLSYTLPVIAAQQSAPLPAWVCKRCDEPYFEPPEVARVREALRFVRRRARA